MKKTLITIIFMAAFFSCQTPQNTYFIGDKFKIKLEKNTVGGYAWEMKQNEHVNILIEEDSAYYNPISSLTEYTKVFELEAIKKGNTDLLFIKKRPFEPDSLTPKENFKTINITIKKP